MPKGYVGKLLWVDLTSGKITCGIGRRVPFVMSQVKMTERLS